MYCPKCGKENPEDARFCMHCGADLSGYKVEISPKVEVSPKISVSAKAEGGLALKWKKKPKEYANLEGYGSLPFYQDDDFVTLEGRAFCPLCGNYDCLEEIGSEIKTYDRKHKTVDLFQCLACNKYLLGESLDEQYERSRAAYEARFGKIIDDSICAICNKHLTKYYTCSLCGKRICENCAVTKVVKSGLFSKETIKLCPNCAKEKR